MQLVKTLLTVGFATGIAVWSRAAAIALVPAPQRLVPEKGTIVWNAQSRFYAAPQDAPASEAAGRLGEWFPAGTASADSPALTFATRAGIPAEGYSIRPEGTNALLVEASDAAGFFYALQTLRQLGEKQPDGSCRFPCVSIDDAPRYPWRGLLIDEGRHFFGKAAIQKMLGLMAYHKLNVMQWHLTEDQGWRLAINRYPGLVQYGAVRSSSPARWHRKESDGRKYGPFYYTQADVREIVACAKRLHIRIVPEIEIPGHVRAALAAYPEFSCVGPTLSPREPWTHWGISEDVLCAGNDEALRFEENILDEVCALFDSPFIHIGGDECPKTRWKACPKCQARIKAEGLKDERELQSWVIRHFCDYLAKKGRRLIGWDEILEGGLPAGASVMSWHGAAGGIAAAAAGHDVVMAPQEFCYFSMCQFKTGDPVEYSGNYLPLAKAYAFDPCAGIPEAQQKRILGGEGACWAEYTRTPAELEWKTFPRASALAECLWTAPAARDFGDFLKRMRVHRARLLALGVNAAPLSGF